MQKQPGIVTQHEKVGGVCGVLSLVICVSLCEDKNIQSGKQEQLYRKMNSSMQNP